MVFIYIKYDFYGKNTSQGVKNINLSYWAYIWASRVFGPKITKNEEFWAVEVVNLSKYESKT